MSDFKEYYYLSFLSKLENKTIDLYPRKEIVCYPKLNDGSRILDIGSYGKSAYLGPGKNTSDFISEFYTNCLIDGINLQRDLDIKKTNINLITGDFFKYRPKYKYDYIINDLSHRHNRTILQGDYLLTEVPKILNKGGYYLQYTFRNDGSNSEDVNVAIEDREVRKDFLNKFWKIDKTELLPEDMIPILQEKLSQIYDIILCKKELERDYINWFMLRLK